jgi:hypothetical protein
MIFLWTYPLGGRCHQGEVLEASITQSLCAEAYGFVDLIPPVGRSIRFCVPGQAAAYPVPLSMCSNSLVEIIFLKQICYQ